MNQEQKDAYTKKAEALIRQWSAEMEKLKAKANRAEADAQIEYQRQMEDLRLKESQVKQKLAEIKSSEDAAWTELRTGLDRAISDLKLGIEQAVAKFK